MTTSLVLWLVSLPTPTSSSTSHVLLLSGTASFVAALRLLCHEWRPSQCVRARTHNRPKLKASSLLCGPPGICSLTRSPFQWSNWCSRSATPSKATHNTEVCTPPLPCARGGWVGGLAPDLLLPCSQACGPLVCRFCGPGGISTMASSSTRAIPAVSPSLPPCLPCRWSSASAAVAPSSNTRGSLPPPKATTVAGRQRRLVRTIRPPLLSSSKTTRTSSPYRRPSSLPSRFSPRQWTALLCLPINVRR